MGPRSPILYRCSCPLVTLSLFFYHLHVLISPLTGHPQMDLICLSDEPVPVVGKPLNYHPLGLDKAVRSITPSHVTSLRLHVFSNGKVFSTDFTLRSCGSLFTFINNSVFSDNASPEQRLWESSTCTDLYSGLVSPSQKTRRARVLYGEWLIWLKWIPKVFFIKPRRLSCTGGSVRANSFSPIWNQKGKKPTQRFPVLQLSFCQRLFCVAHLCTHEAVHTYVL